MTTKRCRHCNGNCIKKGKSKNIQRYRCKQCGKSGQSTYRKKRVTKMEMLQIKNLHNEDMGISSIARFMGVPFNERSYYWPARS